MCTVAIYTIYICTVTSFHDRSHNAAPDLSYDGCHWYLNDLILMGSIVVSRELMATLELRAVLFFKSEGIANKGSDAYVTANY